MAVGLLHADVVNTVSETYAREILTPEYGEGMGKLLESGKERLFGILNGIDYDAFDPQKDPYLPRPYSASDLAGEGGARGGRQRRARGPAAARGRVLVFDAYGPAALAGALGRGVKASQQREAWSKLQMRVMG